jgi:acetoin utilization deacetylase AcuC-like enzyme
MLIDLDVHQGNGVERDKLAADFFRCYFTAELHLLVLCLA